MYLLFKQLEHSYTLYSSILKLTRNFESQNDQRLLYTDEIDGAEATLDGLSEF